MINPGRNISADRSLKPELIIDTRCVVMYDKNTIIIPEGEVGILEATEQAEPETALQIVSDTIDSALDSVLEIKDGPVIIKDPDGCGFTIIINGGDYANEEITDILDGTNAIGEFDTFFQGGLIKEEYLYSHFAPGDVLYQGLPTNVTAVGTVKDYDKDRQLVTFGVPQGKTVEETIMLQGHLKEDEHLIGQDKKANVILEGQSDCRIIVNGSAKPEGKFIDDTSKVSEWYAVIQDSYRYQWFSYVIASPIQQVDYETFVKEIIHPAGFIQFADLTIHSSVKTRTLTGERDLVTIFIDPCSPFKLLAADGTPILAGTESGHKFILVKEQLCEDVPMVDVLGLTIPGVDNTPLEIVDPNIDMFTGILLRLNI